MSLDLISDLIRFKVLWNPSRIFVMLRSWNEPLNWLDCVERIQVNRRRWYRCSPTAAWSFRRRTRTWSPRRRHLTPSSAIWSRHWAKRSQCRPNRKWKSAENWSVASNGDTSSAAGPLATRNHIFHYCLFYHQEEHQLFLNILTHHLHKWAIDV